MLSTISDDKIRYEVEQLYINFSRNCYYEALNITKDKNYADDVVQLVFENLINYLDKHSFSDIQYPKAFLITLSKREAINYMRKFDISKNDLVGDSDEYEQVTDNEPLTNVLRLDQAGEFLKKLERINPEYARVIVLKCAKEFSYDEISKLLGITPVNVRNRYSRAKKAYKKLILGGDINE